MGGGLWVLRLVYIVSFRFHSFYCSEWEVEAGTFSAWLWCGVVWCGEMAVFNKSGGFIFYVVWKRKLSWIFYKVREL